MNKQTAAQRCRAQPRLLPPCPAQTGRVSPCSPCSHHCSNVAWLLPTYLGGGMRAPQGLRTRRREHPKPQSTRAAAVPRRCVRPPRCLLPDQMKGSCESTLQVCGSAFHSLPATSRSSPRAGEQTYPLPLPTGPCPCHLLCPTGAQEPHRHPKGRATTIAVCPCPCRL